MLAKFFRYNTYPILVTALWMIAAQPLLAQHRPLPHLGVPHRPLIKLTGFLDPNPPETTTKTLLTLALPGHEKRYTFLLSDMQIMAGPIRTPGSILDEVKPYSPNFYVRASREAVAQITTATPAEPLTILAEYGSADRSLLVLSVERSGESQQQ